MGDLGSLKSRRIEASIIGFSIIDNNHDFKGVNTIIEFITSVEEHTLRQYRISSRRPTIMEAFHQSRVSTIPRHNDTYPFISPAKHAGSLKGKVALITGAGRGIGRATALAFAAAGAHVVSLSRTVSDGEALVKEISQRGQPKALALEGDVADPTVPARVVKDIEASLGPIDILINNAGISRVSDVEHETDMARVFQVINISLHGALAFNYAVLPSMIARKTGTIINIVSIIAAVNMPYFSGYAAAKTGLIRATEIQDMEFRPHGIHCYAVSPGMVADTTLGVGAINMEMLEKVDEAKQFLTEFMASLGDTLALPADFMVALVAEPDAKLMSGRYVDVTQDLEAMLQDAKRGPEGRIEKEGLYKLKVNTL